MIPTGLQKRYIIPPAFDGPTDIWRGNLGDAQVAIKALRIYPAKNLEKAKGVSEHRTRGSPR